MDLRHTTQYTTECGLYYRTRTYPEGGGQILVTRKKERNRFFFAERRVFSLGKKREETDTTFDDSVDCGDRTLRERRTCRGYNGQKIWPAAEEEDLTNFPIALKR